MPKEEHFERYTPQFPLSNDITDMSEQDTLCKFCGVSYLIHNEIKTLEAKCQKLETELAYHTGKKSRETNLKQTSQNEQTRISDLESINAINTHKLNEMSRKLQLLQDQLEESENAHKKTKSSISKYSSNLRVTHNQIQNIRKEYLLLQDLYSKDTQNWKTYLQTTENTLQKELQTSMTKFTKQINDQQTETEQYKQQLKETNQSLHDLQIKYQQIQSDSKESHSITQIDLESAHNEIKIHQDELSRLHKQILQYEQTQTQLQNELQQSKQYSHELEQQLSDKNGAQKDIDQYRQQLTIEKELRLKNDTELENLRSKLLQLTTEYEQLNSMKTEFQINESNTRRKIDETNRSRQAILDRTRDEYEKLLRKYTDLDEIYRELVPLREKDTLELKKNRSELQRLHNENVELTKQQETLHITQDIQIKKLHDNYSNKLREAEQWPDRLQLELKREREQHRTQMNEFERRLKENFVTELNIEKQKYDGLLRKYEHERGSSNEQLRHELISTEKVTMEHRRYYTKQIEQLEKEKDNLQKELDKLRDLVKELHEQIKKQESMDKDHVNNLKLKEDLLNKETNLFQAQSTINELKKDIKQAQEEMMTLQETVHRECTEREQLKDALIAARQQLLALKKNGVLNGNVSRSLHSPPIAFEEIEKRVTAPIPYSQNQRHPTMHPFTQSEPTAYNNSLPDDGAIADLTARPISASQNIQNPYKPLPPIYSQRQKQRRNKQILLSNKTDHLLQNQRRIVRFIRQMK
ncbi:unnamed protein product [Adineta steineri]|uniref:Uncharacterized protein n=1 Tax=Adineta steineri TaxID=433720 RepID=A0A814LKL7_9BILA|nr:unnamed protein product [Adineta steineri]CAF1250550.1 unnamed protein product [Adineta steineri]